MQYERTIKRLLLISIVVQVMRFPGMCMPQLCQERLGFCNVVNLDELVKSLYHGDSLWLSPFWPLLPHPPLLLYRLQCCSQIVLLHYMSEYILQQNTSPLFCCLIRVDYFSLLSFICGFCYDTRARMVLLIWCVLYEKILIGNTHSPTYMV